MLFSREIYEIKIYENKKKYTPQRSLKAVYQFLQIWRENHVTETALLVGGVKQ